MPLVEVIHPEGAFSADGKKKLLESLSATCLRWEGIEVNDVSQSVAWVYLDERPRDSISAGGRPLSQNIYKVNVSVMVGFMDYERIEEMVAEITEAILAADGTEGTGAARVFVIINEVPSGAWGVDGKVWPSVFTAETLGLEPRASQADGRGHPGSSAPRCPARLTSTSEPRSAGRACEAQLADLAVPPTREASSGMGTDGYDAKLSAELVQMMREDIGP